MLPLREREIFMRQNFPAVVTSLAVGASLAGSTSAAPHDFQTGDVICGVMSGNYKIYDNNGVYIETIYDTLRGATTGAVSSKIHPIRQGVST